MAFSSLSYFLFLSLFHWCLWAVGLPVRACTGAYRSAVWLVVAVATLIGRVARVALFEAACAWGDIKAGVRVGLGSLSLSWLVVFALICFLSTCFVGLMPTLTFLSICALCIGGKYGGRVPRYVRAHVERIQMAWAAGMEDDDCCEAAPTTGMDRITTRARPSVACKIAVRAISKVGILKRTEANAMVYQRLCLDVMGEMKMRYHDRLVILPQAVLACLERPAEVEEVMVAVKASCEGRLDNR
ncbi:replicase associated protein [Elderberry aureusvirus 1]|nr:replicase associated protein [Elderberry aureusvirus 1]AXP98763.1 replicase associated protein [Elderberry aureusvirus 1]